MRLNTDWIFQEPIDLEHKQYVLLDYINKVNKDFEDFKIYPSFQELAIHLANIGAIREQGKFVRLRREPEDIDDEILKNIENNYPIFRVKYEEKFPLEGSILSISKRKIMNYIFQTIKIQELKG